jgi:cytoskeletal protein CcmA (bactofilin family)
MHARWLVALALAGCSAGEEVTVIGPDAAATPDAVVDVVRPIDVVPYDVTPLDVVRGEDVVPEAAVDTGPDVITREQFCMGAGPPVVVGDRVTMSTRCVGRIAEAVFRHAICTCTDLGLAGYLQTDSFDSGASMMMAENGGAVGINGGLSLVGVMRIGDALTMSGTAPLRLIGAHTVRGDLALQGDLQVAGTLDVERNARIRGNLLAIGPFRVRGDLTTQPGTLPLGVINVSGARRSANVDVAPPCACRDSEIFDVRGAVTDASARNDNAAAGFRRDVFNAVVGQARVELPCGRFFVDRIAGLGAITLSVQGRTALFVGGDFDLGGYFNVELGPMGELDVFVAGSILGAGYLRMGRVARPSKVRFYIGGERGFTLAGVAGFQGNVYAPRAPVTIAGFNEMRGSLFAGRVATAGDLTIHYDRSVLRAGDDCPPEMPPAGGCTGCGVGVCRATQACVSGACAMCRTDADCCAPFVCETRTGQCLPLPP